MNGDAASCFLAASPFRRSTIRRQHNARMSFLRRTVRRMTGYKRIDEAIKVCSDSKCPTAITFKKENLASVRQQNKTRARIMANRNRLTRNAVSQPPIYATNIRSRRLGNTIEYLEAFHPINRPWRSFQCAKSSILRKYRSPKALEECFVALGQGKACLFLKLSDLGVGRGDKMSAHALQTEMF